MRFKFDEHAYQTKAVNAVADIFQGQLHAQCPEFSEPIGKNAIEGPYYSNPLLTVDDRAILANLSAIQNSNNIEDQHLVGDRLRIKHFTVEMATGTGKTYVYLRTILELNKRYGFAKFIIVVPSLAIREGVSKAIDVTKEHFKALYGKSIDRYNKFDAKVDNHGKVEEYANSDDISILIVNIQTFGERRKVDKEQGRGYTGKTLMARSRPIIILDEAQRFDSETSKQHIDELNPLFVLRYSATHKTLPNLVYSLNLFEAQNHINEQGVKTRLVKRIFVDGIESEGSSRGYIKIVKIQSSSKDSKGKDNNYSVTIEINTRGGERKQFSKLKEGDSLFELSGKLDEYEGYEVKSINNAEKYVVFANDITKKHYFGRPIDDDTLRQQIRRTVEFHFAKELELRGKGIKVLSLFFVDKVSHYTGEGKSPGAAKFRQWFEEEFRTCANDKQYKDLPLSKMAIDEVHSGCFAEGKDGRPVDDAGAGKTNELRGYDKIMKNKEVLLDVNEPLRFIFTHGVLKEGWDNPNVFQVCVLRGVGSAMERAQQIGRGVRLAVNSCGERIDDRIEGHDLINRLTVIADESFQDFAYELTKERKASGIKYGIISPMAFAKNIAGLIRDDSKAIFESLVQGGVLSKAGAVLVLDDDKLRDKVSGALPENLRSRLADIEDLISRIEDVIKLHRCNSDVENNAQRKKAKAVRNKESFDSPVFQELWGKIARKTKYTINIKDSDAMIKRAAAAIKREDKNFAPKKTEFRRIELIETPGGIKPKDGEDRRQYEPNVIIPNVIKDIEVALKGGELALTRRSLVKILRESDSIKHCTQDPIAFVKHVVEAINKECGYVAAENVEYKVDGATHPEPIEEINHDLAGDKIYNVQKVAKTLYDHIPCYSKPEKKFAEAFDIGGFGDIEFWLRLPHDFKVATPLGYYTPDWGVAIKKQGDSKIRVVVDSKSSVSEDSKRKRESEKMKCAKKHFDCLGDVEFNPSGVDSVKNLIDQLERPD